MKKYDVIVVGAGHAGSEASLSASRVGAKVCLITLRYDRIAVMSCNPAIGGVAKGHLVREIDALGGMMSRVADKTGIHFRNLNESRGPAVRSTRCQSDSTLYHQEMTKVLEDDSNIDILEDEVKNIHVLNNRVGGVVAQKRGVIFSDSVIITTGTFLNGLCLRGEESFLGGRINDAPVLTLSDSLKDLGIQLKRFKTGTTPRLKANTINWDKLKKQEPIKNNRPRFSFDFVNNNLTQIPCYITSTNQKTHALIKDNLLLSPLYKGIIKGLGPRYCPSIEDKIVRFKDKISHQIFLEPEGLSTDRIYPNGISTSLPKNIQDKFLRTMLGLEKVKVIQYGYAVEYDYSPPIQLNPSLMTKALKGLFLAGQINGTSGYEEAAAQGLIAGLNATRYIDCKKPLILKRDDAYIGVLIDDLVTKGVDEPYRIFTSRAEHRLTLRESNAQRRLTKIAENYGLLKDERLKNAKNRLILQDSISDFLHKTPLGKELAEKLELGDEKSGMKRSEVLKRPHILIEDLLDSHLKTEKECLRVVEENIKYSGYIKRELREIKRLHELEEMVLPTDMKYSTDVGFSTEVLDKLSQVKPQTLGQASRIKGMTPAGLALLRIYTHRFLMQNRKKTIEL